MICSLSSHYIFLHLDQFATESHVYIWLMSMVKCKMSIVIKLDITIYQTLLNVDTAKLQINVLAPQTWSSTVVTKFWF
jgi:hypothetical protein